MVSASDQDNDNDEDEGAVFRRAMSDVDRQHKNYHQRRHNPVDDRPRPSVPLPRKKPLDRTDTWQDITDPAGPPGSVLFARPGLQKNIIKRLKRGQYTIEDDLDLHGRRRFEADDMLEEFIADALEHAMTCVLIIHGKGYHSENNQSVLKQFTLEWLQQAGAVKAFCSAQPKHGGTGAVYVLLKTSTRR